MDEKDESSPSPEDKAPLSSSESLDPQLLAEAFGEDKLAELNQALAPGELAEDREQTPPLSEMLASGTLDGLGPLAESLPPEKEKTKKIPKVPKKKKRQNPLTFEKQSTLVQELTPKKPPFPTPEKIGPYKIEGLLDRGGMSLLYLGVHPDTQEALTLKVLLPKYLSQKEMKARFLKEAEIISLTDHPNIVKLHGHGEWEQGLYIAMEFIRGISLKQFILQNSMSVKKALELILKVAYALAHLHTHGVIHRDLKPENILLTDQGGIKVIDFGIAQLESSSQDRLTQSKRMMGTPIYMSPEQKEDPLKINYNSDIYALGIIAYELLLGKLSHGVVHLNLMPKGFQKILKNMLHLDPKKRYQDIVEVIQAISSYLKSPKLEKDIKGKDLSSELVEKIAAAQKKLLPPSPPKDWKNITIGLCHHSTLDLYGLYYDFFTLPEGKYGIILGESAAKGAEGVVFTAVLRGMARALANTFEDPIGFVEQINTALARDSLDEIFTLSFLILNPNNQSLQFLSCGFGNLWLHALGSKEAQLIHSENIALGIEEKADILQVSHSWRTGDTLLLNTFSMLSEKDPENKLLKKALKDNLLLDPEKQAEAIMRQVKKSTTSKKKLTQRPLTLISIQKS